MLPAILHKQFRGAALARVPVSAFMLDNVCRKSRAHRLAGNCNIDMRRASPAQMCQRTLSLPSPARGGDSRECALRRALNVSLLSNFEAALLAQRFASLVPTPFGKSCAREWTARPDHHNVTRYSVVADCYEDADAGCNVDEHQCFGPRITSRIQCAGLRIPGVASGMVTSRDADLLATGIVFRRMVESGSATDGCGCLLVLGDGRGRDKGRQTRTRRAVPLVAMTDMCFLMPLSMPDCWRMR